MREKIIEVSIQSLQKEGLRFSVDELARALKISKKTVYKYFATKEELAIAIYERFYESAEQQITEILQKRSDRILYELLTVYYGSYRMVRKEVFNKYALNDSICRLATARHAHLFEKISALFPPEERDALQIIIDGTFRKLTESDFPCPEQVIERLVHCIC